MTLIYMICITILTSECRSRETDSEIESVASSGRPLPSNLVFKDVLHAPMDDLSKEAPSEDQALLMIQQKGVNLNRQNIFSKVLLTGERVFFLREDDQTIPVVSVQHDIVYQWSQASNAQIAEGKVKYSLMNMFDRHLINEEAYPGKDPTYFLYQIDNDVGLIRLNDHVLMNDHVEFRSGNTLYSEHKKKIFEYVPLADHVWRIQGQFDNGYLCEGAVIWRDPTETDTFYTGIKQYGTTQVYKWNRIGGVLHFKENITQFNSLRDKVALVHACPGREEDSVVAALAKNTYLMVDPGDIYKTPPKKIQSMHYKPGTRVLINDSVYSVLFTLNRKEIIAGADFATTMDFPEIYVTNINKTSADDHGKIMQHVYKWYDNKLTDLGTKEAAMMAMADLIHKISLVRIKDTQDTLKLADAARWQLSLAEQKAAGIDTPTKLMMSFFVCAALSTAGEYGTPYTWKLGSKALSKLASIDFFGPANTSTRIVAGLSLIMTYAIVTKLSEVKIANGTPEQNKMANSLSGAATMGIRGVFPKNQNTYLDAGSTKLAMRWTPLSAEQKAEYEKSNAMAKVAGLEVKTATVHTSTFNFLYNGTSTLIQLSTPNGVVLDDLLAGKETPSRLVGGAIEWGTTFLVADPRIRPFAMVLAKQVNALLQFGESGIRSANVSKKFDLLKEMWERQQSIRDGLLWYAKQAPGQLEGLSPVEKAYIVSTIGDPSFLVRSYYSQ